MHRYILFEVVCRHLVPLSNVVEVKEVVELVHLSSSFQSLRQPEETRERFEMDSDSIAKDQVSIALVSTLSSRFLTRLSPLSPLESIDSLSSRMSSSILSLTTHTKTLSRQLPSRNIFFLSLNVTSIAKSNFALSDTSTSSPLSSRADRTRVT